MLTRKNRNRPRTPADGPTLLERIDWRAVGGVAGTLAACTALVALVTVALDRPVHDFLEVGQAGGCRRVAVTRGDLLEQRFVSWRQAPDADGHSRWIPSRAAEFTRRPRTAGAPARAW